MNLKNVCGYLKSKALGVTAVASTALVASSAFAQDTGLSSLSSAVDFSDAKTALLAVAAVVVTFLVFVGGALIVMSFIGSKTKKI